MNQIEDRWSTLAAQIEEACHATNRVAIDDSRTPLAYDVDGARRMTMLLREHDRPMPAFSLEDGDIRLAWTRLDGHAYVTVRRGQRLVLDMAMDHRTLLQEDMAWRNDESVNAPLRAFLQLLDHFTPLKQVIVVRRDLKMRQGKSVSQGSHASGEFMREQLLVALAGEAITLTSDEVEWMTLGMAKITVKAETFEQFQDIAERARLRGLKVRMITDSGRTEFHGVPTVTALAIGPTRSAYVDGITGGLTLL